MATHTAKLIRTPTIQTFVPLKSFEGYDNDGNLLAMYKKGARYSIREGNTMLRDLVAGWAEQRLVKIEG